VGTEEVTHRIVVQVFHPEQRETFGIGLDRYALAQQIFLEYGCTGLAQDHLAVKYQLQEIVVYLRSAPEKTLKEHNNTPKLQYSFG
jgi:hypothetical protein